MKISHEFIIDLIKELKFKPEDGTDGIYYKKYVCHNDYVIRINFNTQKIEYRSIDVYESEGICLGDSTTSNFENSENFVVLECVDRLLEKGYPPKNIHLEHKFPLGRIEKGKLDILVFDNDNKAYLMIECKTWGTEFFKEKKRMQKDGGQLFSYFVQDKATKYLCLYTSHKSNEGIEYKTDIIKVDEIWSELSNQKEIYDYWNKNVKDNGIFEDWANAYDIEIKALLRSRLLPLTKDDSGHIFNQFAEILRHNVVSDKPNAFNKILNLFICKIIDEDKNDNEQVEFQWLDDDTYERLQLRLNDLYKKGMHRFLDIDVTDFTENDISHTLVNIGDDKAQKAIRDMIVKLRLQKNPEFAFIEVYDETSFKLNARVVKEVVELLQPYQFRYGHKQQFLGDFFELLLNTSIKQEAGQYFTPVPITRYIVSSLPIKEFIQSRLKTNDPNILPIVMDFACGTGHFLTEFMDRVQTIIEHEIDSEKAMPTVRKKIHYWSGEDGKFEWANTYVYGIDADYRLVKSSKVSSFLNGDGEANIIRANGLDHFTKSKEFKGKLKQQSNEDYRDNGQFDILIANPPYSVNSFKSTVKHGDESFELFKRLTDNSSEIECLFVERMKQLLKAGGYAGIILPSSILSSTGIYTATREIILKYFKLIAITEFGSNTFMATGTNTVTLFLERRPNTDHKQIINSINSFFERPKDVTVVGIEKPFKKYVNYVLKDISYDDYVSFISKKPTEVFCELELYKNYIIWFENLTETKNLKSKKTFRELSNDEQQNELNKLFYEKVFAIEKDKLLYFMLTYQQSTVIVKVGEKQAEKDFIGYEFSTRRGHEGIKMLPTGTKLYDETGLLNSKKANSYIYNAFMGKYNEIDNELEDNLSYVDTVDLLDYSNVQFEKIINYSIKKKQNLSNSIYEHKKIANVILKVKRSTEKIDTSLIKQQGNIPVISQNQEEFIDGYCDTNTPIDDLPLTLFGDHNCCFKYIDFPFVRGGDGTRLLKCSGELLPKFFHIIIKSQKQYITNSNKYERHFKYLKELYIPIPPLDIQEKIVNEINEVEQIENNSFEKIASLKEQLQKPQYFSYETERIEKITTMVQRGKSAKYGTSDIQIIKSGQARGYNNFDFSQKYYVNSDFISDERNLQKCDILINSTGVGTAGRVTLFDLDGDYVVDSHITIVRIDQSKAVPKYVMYALANIGFKNIEAMATGQSGQIELSLPIINSIRIPLPSLEKQIEIVNQIEVIEKKIQTIENDIKASEDKKKNILDKYLR